MTIEEMKKRKIELGLTNQTLSEKSGVPEATLQKIFSGKTKAPRAETIRALERVLERKNSAGTLEYGSGAAPDLLKETSSVYSVKKRLYTLEDYLALPEDQRVELIDGVFYDMAAPTTVHQAIGGFLYKLLLDHVLENQGPCMPFMSPVDVQLDCDDKTVVQPDVLIVCDRSKFQNGRVFGAPDFLAEVLSPSTRKKDMQLKLYKYANAGVREYWMIDPLKKKILVYDLEHESFPVLYGFDDTIPVLIWEGRCQIDFSKIYAAISFLYD